MSMFSLLSVGQFFTFRVTVLTEMGKHGIFTKKVEASTQGMAWLQVTRDLKVNGLLSAAVSIELVS